MEKTPVQKWAKTLRIMVSVFMVFNLIALYFVPMFEFCTPEEIFTLLRGSVLCLLDHQPDADWEFYIPVTFIALMAWGECLDELPWAFYTIFRFTCGCCTYGILRQARHILDTVLEGVPFQTVNSQNMRRAAKYCWVIAAAALLRLVVELFCSKGLAALFTYNALFIPVFLVGGLLFWLMSALFCQAAELKEDQDLTI